MSEIPVLTTVNSRRNRGINEKRGMAKVEENILSVENEQNYQFQNKGFNTFNFGVGQSSNRNDGFGSPNNTNFESFNSMRQRNTTFGSSNKQDESSNKNSSGQNNTGISFNPNQQKVNFDVLDIFEQKELELKQQILKLDKEKQQQDKINEIKERANQINQMQSQGKAKQGQEDYKLKLSSPVFTQKKGGSIIENQRRQQQQQSGLKSNLNNNNNSSSNNSSNSFKPNFGGLGNGNKKNLNSTNNNFSANKNQFSNNNYNNIDPFEDSTEAMGGYMQMKAQNQNEKNAGKKQVNNFDDQAAVATGVNEALFEESQQLEEVQLMTCPEGCGRQFTEQALQKHVGVCKKVFQQKKQSSNKDNKNTLQKGSSSNNNRDQSKGKDIKKKTAAGGNLKDFKQKMKQQKQQLEQNGEIEQQYV